MEMLSNTLFLSRNTVINRKSYHQELVDLFRCSYPSMKVNVSEGLAFEQTIDLNNIHDVTYNDVMRGLEAFADNDYSLGNKANLESGIMKWRLKVCV